MLRFSPNLNSAHRIHWREWGADAFDLARQEDKPVMLCLCAFWCGICQRMDETTFSTDEVVALLNAYFVPVRVEDAQRPDIDVRYNKNGWPTLVFLTPGGDFLASVNYLSPTDFSDVLVRVHVGYHRGDHAAAPAPPATLESAGPGEAAPVRPEAAREIAEIILADADPVHGGYGSDRKFPHCEVNEFFLRRYETTRDARYLNHVRLTLVKMHQSKTHDDEGGFFRYSSKPDWNEPHREKLLSDHAGLLSNALHVFELTGEAFFQATAEEIIAYLERSFRDSREPFFHGCRDYLRIYPQRDLPEGAILHKAKGMFSLTDGWMYTDANARAVSALLRAAKTLGRPDLVDSALETLRFLQARGYDDSRGVAHYFDDAPRVWGLLTDQVSMGFALLDAYEASRAGVFLQHAEALAGFTLARLRNPTGGFFDIAEKGPAHLRYPLTLLTENGATALFFVKLHEATGKPEYRDAAAWACQCFSGDFASYGLHAAEYGTALQAYLDSGG